MKSLIPAFFLSLGVLGLLLSACGDDDDASPRCQKSINCCREYWAWRVQNNPDYDNVTAEGLAAEQANCESLADFSDKDCDLMIASLQNAADVPEGDRPTAMPACYAP